MDFRDIGRGAVSDEEWDALCRGLCLAKASTKDNARGWRRLVVEVGTLGGKTTSGIRQVLDRVAWRGVDILTIDKDKGCFSKMNAAIKKNRGGADGVVKFHHGTSYSFFGNWVPGTAPEVVFAFVDGCHCEDCVRIDIEAIVPHLQDGGVIAFHDAGNQRALGMKVHERYHGDGIDRLYGVTEAVEKQIEGGHLRGFELVEKVAPTKRERGAPVPIRGGLVVYQRRS